MNRTVIKKYSNRRLYNTNTSSYINLSGICDLINNNEDFIVVEANSERDITCSILVQIILDYETKGYELLPVNFLKNLIKFYDAASKDVVTHFLENTAKFFTKCQENSKVFNNNFVDSFNSNKFMEEISNLTQKNMDFFFKTLAKMSSTEEKKRESYAPESEKV
ncbi:MAG: polyhydroxyalkanoate synthesis repressor PhaR [Rickettsiales bacterium]|nr:polyhydroxyalkanoate synthesis repressor PhaR [Rickettsiales bacterium]